MSFYRPSRHEPKPKWYNWTGDAGWNEYCLWAWLVVFIPGGSFIGFCIWLIAIGRTS